MLGLRERIVARMKKRHILSLVTRIDPPTAMTPQRPGTKPILINSSQILLFLPIKQYNTS